jgi:hypothetical protein
MTSAELLPPPGVRPPGPRRVAGSPPSPRLLGEALH